MVLQQSLLNLLDIKKPWDFTVIKVPQQTGGNDCGVYALQMVKHLILQGDEAFPPWEHRDMKMIRSTMILELSELSIRWNKMI